MRPSRRLLPFLNAILLFLIHAACPVPARSQSPGQLPAQWNDALQRLATKIASAAEPNHTLSLEVNNISSLGPADVAGIRQELESELAHRGLRTVAADAAPAQVIVTLSESAEAFVWVAEVRVDDTKKIAIIDVARPRDSARPAIPSMTLQRNLQWVQPGPILDFAMHAIPGGAQSLAIALTPKSLDTYDMSSGGDRSSRGSSPISQMQASRDLRGQLTFTNEDQIKAHVGETICVSELTVGSGLNCGKESSGGWIFPDGSESHYVAGRNFFRGFVVSPDGSVTQPPFYTAATRTYDHGSRRIQTELDGKARLYNNGVSEPEATFPGWGDDIATIVTDCDSRWHVLVTGTGDWTQPDQIQIYEITDHQAVAIGQPMEFPGPILALWTAVDGKSARVVSRNLQTGMYEASIVSVACGN